MALAVLALHGANFLLMDEPTNHLDLLSQEVLEDVLGDFPGTILFVSHDRYFIDALATAVWAVEGTGVAAYQGGYQDYLDERGAAPAAWSRSSQPSRRARGSEMRRTHALPAPPKRRCSALSSASPNSRSGWRSWARS